MEHTHTRRTSSTVQPASPYTYKYRSVVEGPCHPGRRRWNDDVDSTSLNKLTEIEFPLRRKWKITVIFLLLFFLSFVRWSLPFKWVVLGIGNNFSEWTSCDWRVCVYMVGGEAPGTAVLPGVFQMCSVCKSRVLSDWFFSPGQHLVNTNKRRRKKKTTVSLKVLRGLCTLLLHHYHYT